MPRLGIGGSYTLPVANARIDGILAREAPIAVVFRRGPSKLTQQLLWNTETDEITPGQWIAGRVHTKRCDLSPDGKLLVGAYTNYSGPAIEVAAVDDRVKYWHRSGWTAVSRPPHFTALALWFMGGSYNGGGIWRGPRILAVNNFAHHWETALRPKVGMLQVNKLGLGPSADFPFFGMLLAARGWRHRPESLGQNLKPGRPTVAEAIDLNELVRRFCRSLSRANHPVEGVWEKAFVGGLLRFTQADRQRWDIVEHSGQIAKTFDHPWHGTQLLDVDHRGRLIFSEGGCLYAWEGFPQGKAKLVADLNGNRFEPIPPPDWATEWPNPNP